MVHITARRYTDRNYPVTDVKVYSNAGRGQPAAEQQWHTSARRLRATRMPTWKNVKLNPGENKLVATGKFGSKKISDNVTLDAARRPRLGVTNVIIGPVTGDYGQRFGSDAFPTDESYASSFGVGNKKSLTLADAVKVASTLPDIRTGCQEGS